MYHVQMLAEVGQAGATIGPFQPAAIALSATLVVIIGATKWAKKPLPWNQSVIIGGTLPTIYAAAGAGWSQPIDWAGSFTAKIDTGIPQIGNLGLGGVVLLCLSVLVYIRTKPLPAALISFLMMYAAGRSGNLLLALPADFLGSLMSAKG